MARILAIDYGAKRSGLAETDDLQIVASRVKGMPTSELMGFIEAYASRYKLAGFVMGEPTRWDGSHSDIWAEIQEFSDKLKKKFPDLPIHFVDERFSSKMAVESMIQAGVPKKKRRNKEDIDAQSATLILQDFLSKRRPE
ncbi:MAG: Holliday junction resolvase RuvX [Luteibaculum sp.]